MRTHEIFKTEQYHVCYTAVTMKTILPQDDQWIRNHFEELVNQHAGNYVAVSGGNAYFGKTRKEAEQQALRNKKNTIPSVMQIPHKESLICAL